jgi:hypothetical protein
VLNFALQLEYLEGNYYSYAVSGQGIPANLQTGTGTQGAVITGSGDGAARAVRFTDTVVQQYARENWPISAFSGPRWPARHSPSRLSTCRAVLA